MTFSWFFSSGIFRQSLVQYGFEEAATVGLSNGELGFKLVA
jgi:hypothetical protein